MATKTCEHCGGALTGRQRFWCSDRCRRHESRVTRGLLDPCRARWLLVGAISHAGVVGGERDLPTRLVCGAQPKYRIARTIDSLGLGAYAAHLTTCAHCQSIMR